MADVKPGLWFVFREDLLLVSQEGETVTVPLAQGSEEIGVDVSFHREVGSLNGHPCYAAEASPETGPPDNMVFRELRSLFSGIEEDFFRMAGRAKQIVGWQATHRFCGRCGSETEPVSGEMAKRCPVCGMVYYPRLSPAIIVLVRNGERLLLARSNGFPAGLYSVLAGFVEPGESIEEAVKREVREEVGIEVRNLRYFSSQPWPFPNSLMIGFTAEYAAGELQIDPREIEDAGWYEVGELPTLPPRFSIARTMIEEFIAQARQP